MAKRKMNRKLKAEHKAWQKYRQWQSKNLDKVYEKINSLGEFQEVYRETGRRLSNIRWNMTHPMNRKTYEFVKQRLPEVAAKKIALLRAQGIDIDEFETSDYESAQSKSLSRMTTREVAELFQDDINELRDQLKAEGKSSREISKEVSNYYFGSDN